MSEIAILRQIATCSFVPWKVGFHLTSASPDEPQAAKFQIEGLLYNLSGSFGKWTGSHRTEIQDVLQFS